MIKLLDFWTIFEYTWNKKTASCQFLDKDSFLAFLALPIMQFKLNLNF